MVLNAGGANACTGPDGFQDTHETAEHVAGLLGCGAGEVAVCSTGLIGVRLPLDRLLNGVTRSGEGAHDLRRRRGGARRDDDRHGAQAGGLRRNRLERRGIRQGCRHARARARHDARGAHDRRRGRCSRPSTRALRASTAVTFDRLDSDGCMSTNDTVLLLASGASGVTPSQDELTDGRTAGLRGPRPAAARRRRRREQGHPHRRDERGQRGRCGRRGPSGVAEQPLQVRRPRRGPQLGSGPLGARHHRRDVRAAPGRRDHQRRQGRPRWCRRRRPLGRRPQRPRGRREPSTSGPARRSASVWTNDLTAAYVHENSAYST